MTTAVRQFLMVAIAITTLLCGSWVRAGFVSIVDEDNAGEGSRFDASTNTVVSTAADHDLDSCNTFLDGKTEIILPRASTAYSRAQLVVRAYDVDENAQPIQGYPFPEQDNVIFNNQTLGYLSGEYQHWSSSVFPLAAEQVHSQNLMAIDIDVRGQQQNPAQSLWCVAVDWGQLVFDGGLQNRARMTSRPVLQSAGLANETVTVQMQLAVEALQAGDYWLELSVMDAQGHVMAVGNSADTLYDLAANTPTTVDVSLDYPSDATTGYVSAVAIVYDVTATTNNVWPSRVQDLQQVFFIHRANQAPDLTVYQDQDGDSLLDSWEASGDADADGIENVLDADDDGDGISTRHEHQLLTYLIADGTPTNTDGDALPNYLDLDDDNDGKPSAEEGPWLDSDEDGVLDFLDTADLDPCFPAASHAVCDLDGDGVRNQDDDDIDGDGVANDVDTDSYPPTLADMTITLNENTAFVLNLHHSDQDEDGDVISYTLLPELDAAYFSLNTLNGELNFIEGPDYEQGTHMFQVRVQAQANGKTALATITIHIANVDDETLSQITDIDSQTNQVVENADANSTVGITAQAIDPDGDQVSYSLVSDFDGLFAINATTGVVRLQQAGVLNAQRQSQYTLEVIARSTLSSGEQQTRFTLTVLAYEADSDNDGVPDTQDPDISDPCEPDNSNPVCQQKLEEEQSSGGTEEGKSSQAQGKLKTGKSGIGAVGWLVSILLMCLLLPHSLQAAPWYRNMNIYAGVGAGQSQLSTDTQGTNYQTQSASDDAFKVYLGWDWRSQFAIEGYYSDLGETQFEQQGALAYQAKGVSMLAKQWLMGGTQQQAGLALFAKLGANSLTNTGKGVRYEKTSVLQPLFGLGVQWATPWRFGLRTELEWYGSDAQVFSLSLNKRFGFGQTSQRQTTPNWDEWLLQQAQQQAVQAQQAAVVNEVRLDALISEDDAVALIQALPPTAAIRERTIFIQPYVGDEDGDGILDDEDTCNMASSSTPNDASACNIK